MQSSIIKIFLSGLCFCLCSTVTLASSSKVLILGDSLSAAYNISMEQSWPVIFLNKMKKIDPHNDVINASISGETTAGGAERIKALLALHKPTHLIVELGGNDGLRGFKFSQTRQNLETIIRLALDQNSKVLMIGVRLPPNLGPVYNKRFQQIYGQLADQLVVDYLPQFLQGIAAGNPLLMQQDGIHPTALAQPLLADKVISFFKKNQFQLNQNQSNNSQ